MLVEFKKIYRRHLSMLNKLSLNRSLFCNDDRQITAILINIYHHLTDDICALKFVKQARTLLESCAQSDLSSMMIVFNSIGTIQLSAGLVDDALLTLIRVMHPYEKILPKGHRKQMRIQNNVRRITDFKKTISETYFLESQTIGCAFCLCKLM